MIAVYCSEPQETDLFLALLPWKSSIWRQHNLNLLPSLPNSSSLPTSAVLVCLFLLLFFFFFSLDPLCKYLQFRQLRITPSYGMVFCWWCWVFLFCTRARESGDANLPGLPEGQDLQWEPPCSQPLGRRKWMMKQFTASESSTSSHLLTM